MLQMLLTFYFPSLFSLYDDVLQSIKSWTANGKKVYIYSSGSTEAQQLLFGYSIFGNLLNVICIKFFLLKQKY